MIFKSKIDTPVGKMIIGATNKGVCLFDFEYRKVLPAIFKRLKKHHNCDIIDGKLHYHEIAAQQIGEYFNGDRMSFDLPIVLTGTEFQKNVWNELQKIPYGTTRTYMELARSLGDENTIRAVARANGENCLAIIIPCHRVVGTNGSLTGYAGGLQNKKWLLEFEAKNAGVVYQEKLF